jgi:hypothetical protein
MDITGIRNIGAYLTPRRLCANLAATAAGSGDNTAVVGAVIDRMDLKMPSSMVAITTWSAALTDTKKLSITTLIEHADLVGGPFTTLSTTTTVAKLATASVTYTGVVKIEQDLGSAKRFLRTTITPDLDASGADTMTGASTYVFGPGQEVPAAA